MRTSISKAGVVGVAAVAALVTVGACTSSTGNGQPAPSPVATSAPVSQGAHNHADAMFAQHMIPHHQQAIEMSDIVLAKPGIDSRVLNMARQIKDAQAPEIRTMQGWLTQWGVPAMPAMGTPGHGAMPGHDQMPGHDTMPGHGSMPMPGEMGPGGAMGGMMMDGMMSPADMDALRNAQGVEASRLFLTHMITHHEGAITMAQNVIDNGQYPATVDLARSMISSQQREIDVMRQILGSL